MSPTPVPVPRTGNALLAALEELGPRPVLAWYGEASRIELSGHVLANWVIKGIGHLHDEVALEEGDAVVLDLPPHWKRLVLALAAWSLGAEVTVLPRPAEGAAEADVASTLAAREEALAQIEDPRVVVTDRPDSDLADSADEVLAVQPVSLAPRFDGDLPPLVRDWVVEVRGSSDRLGVALTDWSGPASADGAEAEASATTRLLVPGDGLEVPERLLGLLLAGGGLVGPAASVSAHQADEEGVTTRA